MRSTGNVLSGHFRSLLDNLLAIFKADMSRQNGSFPYVYVVWSRLDTASPIDNDPDLYLLEDTQCSDKADDMSAYSNWRVKVLSINMVFFALHGTRIVVWVY